VEIPNVTTAVGEVVDVEPVGVEGERRPRPEQHREQPREPTERPQHRVGLADLVAQRVAELDRGGDEDQVVKQLQPADALLFVALGVEPWAVEPTAAHVTSGGQRGAEIAAAHLPRR